VDQVLAPELKPGDVVVFDNLKVHLAPGVDESIKNPKATVLRLPPYSSDYNVIEELWSKFKGKPRAIGARTKEHLYQVVGDALDQVTVKDNLGWFERSRVYATQS
jgi:transposase